MILFVNDIYLIFVEALDDYCLQGSLAALIDVMDTYTDPSSIRSALDIIGACSSMIILCFIIILVDFYFFAAPQSTILRS